LDIPKGADTSLTEDEQKIKVLELKVAVVGIDDEKFEQDLALEIDFSKMGKDEEVKE